MQSVTASRVSLAIAAVALTTIVQANRAEACSCAGTTSSATAFRSADLVFVGTVARTEEPKASNQSRVNADGRIIVGGGVGGPRLTTLETVHVYRGRAEQQVVIVGSGPDCDVPFGQAETWLVYARVREGQVTTDTCTRTRLRTKADASRDLAYLDGLESGRQQGVVYGQVLRRRGGGLQALFEPLQVIAVGPAGRFHVTTDEWGPYQLVLPPGDYQVWIERAGNPVATLQVVHVDDGAESRVMLVVEYPNRGVLNQPGKASSWR